MSAVTATFVDSVRGRAWRAFDWQLLLFVALLIGLGVVMGYSASFNEAGQASGGISQTVKTLIWASIGLTIFFVAASIDFQFSEVGKVLMIVVLARWLSGRREKIGKLSSIVGAAILIGIPTFLVFR